MRYKLFGKFYASPYERTCHALFPNTTANRLGLLLFINLYEVGSDRPVQQDEKLDLEPSV